MHYLVTGGAGFIGSNIVEALIRQGERVRVLDNFSTGRRENLLPFDRKIELVEGDLTHLETVRSAVKGVDYVLHQAALPSVQRSIENPIDSNDTNLCGTLNLLVASKEVGVRRVVIASSSSVYGNTEVLPKREDMQPMPLSPYAVSKLACEYYCKVFYKIHGLQTIVLRYFNVFGPNQDPNSNYAAVIPRFIKALMHGERPVIYGDGTQTRDFNYVANVVAANLRAASAGNVGGGLFNIACQESCSLLDLLDHLNRILGTSTKPIFEPWRKGDVRDSLADITAARKSLGYDPAVRLEQGLKQTIAWHKRNGSFG